MSKVIEVRDLSKLYRLGEIGTGTISRDINRWWASVRGKEDPFKKIGETNDRSVKGSSEFVWSLKDINFDVEQGEVLGVIGKNGAGKSTLLKLLSRITAPTSGSIKVKGRIASLLEVGTGFHPDLTGRENVYLNGAIMGMRKAEVKRKFDEIVDFSGVERYIDTPVKRYSSGMYVRLAFAVAAYLEPEILIVDEVLAVGDNEFQKKCLGKMQDVSKNQGRTVLFVSHNMGAIAELCNKCMMLEHGTKRAIGDANDIIRQYLVNAANTEAYFENKPIKEVSVRQKDNALVLNVRYETETGVDIPNLGFVVTNELSVPIFASNPKFDNVQFNRSVYYKGEIEIVIDEPKLLNGTYSISLWFGDSKEDIFHAPNCLAFEVVNKGSSNDLPANVVGSIKPKCKWSFND